MGWNFAVAIFGGRKTFGPSVKPKFMRDVVVTEEFLPSPVKKPRMEVYQEVRKVQRPVHKVIQSQPPANPVKVIEKKPQLYATPVDKPLPQRKMAPKRVLVPVQREPKPVADTPTTTKPVVKEIENKQAKEAPPVKKVNVEKVIIAPEDTKPTVEPNEDGQYELSAAISSILDDELQQIMIEVWQELPDDPPTDAERLVANKFRNEIGDDLQNAMGLSVATRLLNIHNPLYVKLHFSGKPEAGRLQAFIRDYKITAFKRIGDSLRDTFAARFDRIVDFDRFCVHDEVKCGSATVTIIPCYKYLSCPPSVKTIYADNIAKPQTSTNSSPQKQVDTDKKEKTTESEIKTVTKEVVKKVNTATEKSEKPLANAATKKTVITSTNTKEVIKTVATKAAVEKPKTEIKPTKEVPTEIQKVTPKKVENENEAKPEIKPTKVVPTNIQKVTPKKVENENEAKTETKPTKVVPTDIQKVTPKKVENKNEAKTEIKPTKVVPTDIQKVTPKKVENKNEAVKKNDVVDKKNGKELDADMIDDMMVVDEMGEEDDEEMTDQDILALMSGGIVLDECSGSDDEK